jgi:hypothetical protein
MITGARSTLGRVRVENLGRLCQIKNAVGKIVLPCKPGYPLKGKSFFLARFVADLIFVLEIR